MRHVHRYLQLYVLLYFQTPFLPYSKPGPRSVIFHKPGGKEDLFSRPSHVDGPLTSTPLCGTRTMPTMRAMATSEKGGLRLHPSYRPNENFSSRKRQLDKLISIEDFQVRRLIHCIIMMLAFLFTRAYSTYLQ